ncbi:mandelate racemase [Ilyomonas limi]|uniref:Mandelate racemase n=1 Tax=Ilyomonas limi TaxID=2575867 RepID=A0A4V5UU10_9BACT|nr:enolase C-terminal domain-like protein [Ilyomonas limi]TKK67233.1 mandelate racemase [Ilyomonas limi]
MKIKTLTTSVYTVPTASPEADGTFEWNSTTMILVELEAGGKKGLGYTYASIAVATLIDKSLKDMVIGKDAMNIIAIRTVLIQHIRNNGVCGIAFMAVSAIDNALWDLKAKIVELPLCTLLGQAKEGMLLYGSGGFTNYTDKQLKKQLEAWLQQEVKYVKMKIGRDEKRDIERVKNAHRIIGNDAALFVDANGAYSARQALYMAEVFSQYNISWFEEPVSSDNLEGLQFIRNGVQHYIQIAAGEYGYQLNYFKHMLSHKAVDVLQADATRCGGISGFLQVGHLCEAFQIPFSSHCAPALHLHAAIALPNFYIAEYFYDHERLESLLFDGVSPPLNGMLTPDLTRPGFGLEFKYQDAEKYKR